MSTYRSLSKAFNQWLVTMVLTLLAGMSALHAQEKSVAVSSEAAPAAGRVQSVPASGSLEEYRIGPFDLLEISVFGVQEMSRVVRVNAHGMISLPLVGVVRAGGLSANELESALAEKLSENLLQNPQVSVFIKEFVSQRVVVEGSVMKAGLYQITGKTTLLQVIAMSGGLDPVADANSVRIFREGPNGTREVRTFDLEAIRAGQAEDPLIKGNDTVVVDKSSSAAFVKGVTDTLRGFIGFGTVR